MNLKMNMHALSKDLSLEYTESNKRNFSTFVRNL